MHFVSASIYQKALHLAKQEGLPQDILDHHRYVKELQQQSKYLPIDLLYEVYEAAYENLEPGFCIRQGKQLNTEDYGTLGLAWKTCWRARDVLERLLRYMILITDHGSVSLEEQENFTTIYLIRKPVRRGISIANEVSFVMLTGIIKEVTSQAISPTEVGFEHDTISKTPFSEFFDCSVSFSDQANFLSFRTKDLDTPTTKADQSIQKFLMERMEEEKTGILAKADSLLSELHQLIEEALPSGIPSAVQVADILSMSDRTLKRRLSDKNMTFRGLVQNIQQEVATNLLKSTNHNMAEIAFMTGFSEQSAFNRAFKRWNGQSPADYRKNV